VKRLLEHVTATQAAVAVLVGVLLGTGFGWMVDGGTGSSSAEPAAVERHAATTVPLPAGSRQTRTRSTESEGEDVRPAVGGQGPLDLALKRGIGTVRTGDVEAAVMMDGWQEPVVRGAGAGELMRPWSMIKPVTAVTLLRERIEVGAETASLNEPLTRALQRSDNCAQRQLTIALQRDYGNNGGMVLQAVGDTVSLAGGELDLTTAQRNANGRYCVAAGYHGLPPKDVNVPAVLLGTTGWTIDSAVRFFHALRGQRALGSAASRKVLSLLQLPKKNSLEPGADRQLSAPPGWGAGTVFADRCWRLAYKGGWGGHDKGFLAGQMGSVELPGGRWVAFAVMFHPYRQPPNDDPGAAGADVALATVLSSLKRELRTTFKARCS
jgi:hypothetical protein